MPAAQDLLSVAQAAEELVLAPVSVRHAIMRGTLKVVRLDGRTNLVPRGELGRYRQEHLRKRGQSAKTTEPPHEMETWTIDEARRFLGMADESV